MARMTPAARIPIPNAGRQTARRRTGWSTERCRPAPGSKSQTAGAENKQAPHAVHDARDCRQQLNRNAQRTLEPGGGQFCQKQRDAEAHRNGDQQRDKRGDQGSVNRDQRAEDLVRRIPLFGPQKGKAKLLNARPGRDDQGNDDAAQHQ